MLSFDQTPAIDALKNSLAQAISWRRTLFSSQSTTAFRLVNGEGDGIPGLIVDRYHDLLVIQISTLGMRQLRSIIVEELIRLCQPAAIYEKSLLPSRKEEVLKEEQSWLYGQEMERVVVRENGIQFIVEPVEGQKTGFFLDQREMRQWMKELAKGKRVLNAFCYSGGFSIYAFAGGAVSVDSVDISEKAIALARENAVLNGFEKKPSQFISADVFQFLRDRPLDYDIVILDPPAFAKRQKDVISACRGYKDINRLAMERMPPSSLLLTCSCSYHVDETLFRQVLFQAAVEAKRKVQIIGRHRQAMDHPINICHPEGDYLKSFLLHVI